MNQNCLLLSLCPSGTASPLRKKKKKKNERPQELLKQSLAFSHQLYRIYHLGSISKKNCFPYPCPSMWGPQTFSCLSRWGKSHPPILYIRPLATPTPSSITRPLPPSGYLLDTGASMIKEFQAQHFPKGKVQLQELPQLDLNIHIKYPSQPHSPLLGQASPRTCALAATSNALKNFPTQNSFLTLCNYIQPLLSAYNTLPCLDYQKELLVTMPAPVSSCVMTITSQLISPSSCTLC